jgi:hypothetical protein
MLSCASIQAAANAAPPTTMVINKFGIDVLIAENPGFPAGEIEGKIQNGVFQSKLHSVT